MASPYPLTEVTEPAESSPAHAQPAAELALAPAADASPARNAAPARVTVATPGVRPVREKPKFQPQSLWDRIEAFISRLSVRDNFWHAICSFIWLPLAFFSGIRMKHLSDNTFSAVLPFRKFNRNWYNAMAGGALLANSEIAGGMYVFGQCGGDYTVVCRELSYKFLRPCVGPAVYKMTPRQNIKELIATGKEFNVTLDLEVSQQSLRPSDRDKRVGKCVATFHVTPKIQHKQKKMRSLPPGEKKIS